MQSPPPLIIGRLVRVFMCISDLISAPWGPVYRPHSTGTTKTKHLEDVAWQWSTILMLYFYFSTIFRSWILGILKNILFLKLRYSKLVLLLSIWYNWFLYKLFTIMICHTESIIQHGYIIIINAIWSKFPRSESVKFLMLQRNQMVNNFTYKSMRVSVSDWLKPWLGYAPLQLS